MGTSSTRDRGISESTKGTSTANKGTANRGVESGSRSQDGYVVSYPSNDSEDATSAGKSSAQYTAQVLFAGFQVNKSTLTAAHRRGLETLASIMNYEKDSFIATIKGRASQTGPERNNDKLSYDRAKAIAQGLIGLGINASRVYGIEALGSRSPLVNLPSQEIDLNRSASISLALRMPSLPPQPKIERTERGHEQWEIFLSFSVSASIGIGGMLAYGGLRPKGSSTYRRIKFVGVPAGIAGKSFSGSPPSWTSFRTRARYGIMAFNGDFARITSLGGITPVGVGYTIVRLTFTHVSDETINLSGINFGSVGLEASSAFGVVYVLDEVQGGI